MIGIQINKQVYFFKYLYLNSYFKFIILKQIVVDDDKPKTIIIPQKVMKSPLDVVNTFPSKFQNGTFKAHNPPPSDNEESDNEDSDSRNGRHGRSSSKSEKKSKYNSKKIEELKRQINVQKNEVNLQKTKYDLMILKFNEFLTHQVYCHTQCEENIKQDDELQEQFQILQSTYLHQKEDYQKYFANQSASGNSNGSSLPPSPVKSQVKLQQ